MREPAHKSSLALLMAALLASAATAQADPLASIVEKAQIDRPEMAVIETHVKQRIRDLKEAGKGAAAHQKARAVVMETAQNRKASPAGRTAYAQAVADELRNSVIGTQEFELGLDAVLILVELDHPVTARALADCLHSKHAAVRYRAALGIRKIQDRLADQPGAVEAVLRALGAAGSKERDELVLRAMYEAVDFCSAVQNFAKADEAADALNSILSARLAQLEAGSRDEWRDEAGIVAAGGCYSGASPRQQRTLIANLHRFQRQLLDRYASRDTASEYLPTLRRLAAETDTAINKMMQASGVNPPAEGLADKFKAKPSSTSIRQGEAVLSEYAGILAKDPWRIS